MSSLVEKTADQCSRSIISISDSAAPEIKAQAHAFRDQVCKTVAFYMREAIRSDRTIVHNALTDAGHAELAKLIRRL